LTLRPSLGRALCSGPAAAQQPQQPTPGSRHPGPAPSHARPAASGVAWLRSRHPGQPGAPVQVQRAGAGARQRLLCGAGPAPQVHSVGPAARQLQITGALIGAAVGRQPGGFWHHHQYLVFPHYRHDQPRQLAASRCVAAPAASGGSLDPAHLRGTWRAHACPAAAALPRPRRSSSTTASRARA
jgi:hypothetical protein